MLKLPVTTTNFQKETPTAFIYNCKIVFLFNSMYLKLIANQYLAMNFIQCIRFTDNIELHLKKTV